MHGCLVPMIPRLTLGGPEGEPHRETATSALTGKATFSCILCFYIYFSTIGFTTFEYTYNIALYPDYIACVLRFFAYIQKFREKIPQNFARSRLGGTTVRKTYEKWYPYHFTIGFSGLP
eukprot:SAG11_NODE_890_length_6689_cov_18.947951_2_plen_119_part_00